MGALTAPDTGRIQAALARLDTATAAERIEPDSYLGTPVGALREVVEALNGQMGPHAAQLRALVGEARAAADASLAVVREEAEALRVERAKIERFIEAVRVQLGEKGAETVKALVDGIADKLRTATVIRAKAYSRTSYLRRPPPSPAWHRRCWRPGPWGRPRCRCRVADRPRRPTCGSSARARRARIRARATCTARCACRGGRRP